MRVVTNIGRVGALAVALGVGVAAAAGVASAESDGTDTTKAPSATGGSSSVASPGDTDSTPAKTTSPGSESTDGLSDGAGDHQGETHETTTDDTAATGDENDTATVGQDQDATAAGDAQDTDADGTADQPDGVPQDATVPAATESHTTVEQPPVAEPVDEVPAQQPPAAVTDTVSQAPDPPVADPSMPDQPQTRTADTHRNEVNKIAARESIAPASSPDGPVREAKDTEATTVDEVEPAAAALAMAPSANGAQDRAAAARSADPAPAKTKMRPTLAHVIKAVGVTVRKLVTGLLSMFGLAPKASGVPQAPSGLAPVVALLGWGTRRETEPSQALVASPMAAAALAATPAALVLDPTTSRVGWLTGPKSLNNTGVRFGIAGTDLGIMWDNGVTGDNPATAIVEQQQVLIAFGDTFSGANMTGNWRSNVLLRSADNVLSDGLSVPDGIIHDPGAYSGSPMSIPNFSREIIGKYPYSRSTQVTIIPTGAISVAGAGAGGATRQYVAFMSIKSWDTPGRWTTNYSAISYSDDNGQNWTVVPKSSVRSAGSWRSTVPFRSGNQNFQMVSFVKPPEESADAAAGYVYAYGTPSGRAGTVYLSRVNQKQILDVSKYQYWDGRSWRTNAPSAARPVLPGTTTSFLGLFKKTTYPSAGELSVQYNTYLNKYVMLHTDSFNNVVMRTADTPQGTWSPATRLVSSLQYPGLYAPMIHPWSGTDLLKKKDGSAENPQYLYWNMSLWGDYNVALMKTDLGEPATTVV